MRNKRNSPFVLDAKFYKEEYMQKTFLKSAHDLI